MRKPRVLRLGRGMELKMICSCFLWSERDSAKVDVGVGREGGRERKREGGGGRERERKCVTLITQKPDFYFLQHTQLYHWPPAFSWR